MAEYATMFLYLMGFLTYFKELSKDDYEFLDFAASALVSLFWPLFPVLEGLESLWLKITGKL